MIDFSTIKKLTVDGVDLKTLAINGIEVWRAISYTNQVPISINADGAIYNGVGYKNGYRIRSGGAEAAAGDCSCTGYIPCKPGDIVRISGFDFSYEATANAINISDASFANLGQMAMNSSYGYGTLANVSYGSCESVVEEKAGVWRWVVPPESCGVTAYIRVNGRTGGDGSKMIVTINEEIEV